MTQTTKQILALWSDTTECKDTETAIADFYHAAIASYKAELLKEVGEPVYVEGTCELQNWKWIRLAVDQAEEYEQWGWKIRRLYTSDQVAAAILKATKPLEDQLTAAQEANEHWQRATAENENKWIEANDKLAKAEQLWQIAQGRCDGLEEKLAKAEQRVAKYNELIYAVQTKNPDETRHQTALRYIRNAENRPSNTAANGASS